MFTSVGGPSMSAEARPKTPQNIRLILRQQHVSVILDLLHRRTKICTDFFEAHVLQSSKGGLIGEWIGENFYASQHYDPTSLPKGRSQKLTDADAATKI